MALSRPLSICEGSRVFLDPPIRSSMNPRIAVLILDSVSVRLSESIASNPIFAGNGYRSGSGPH